MNIEVKTKSHGTFTVEIDDEDARKLVGHAVFISYKPKRKKAYAMISVNGEVLYLNRYLLAIKDTEATKFIDGNPLNNRKSNFEILKGRDKGEGFHFIRTDNYTGVYCSRHKKKFYVRIITGNDKINLGPFPSEAEAEQAFKEASQCQK